MFSDLDDQVNMIAHQAKCQNSVAELFDPLLQKQIEFCPILLCKENILAAVAPEDNVRGRLRQGSRYEVCAPCFFLRQEYPNVKPDPVFMTRFSNAVSRF